MARRVFVVACLAALVAAPVLAAPLYAPPSGGWMVFYDGDALGASWDHANGSDEWDGSVIGAGRPGGVSALVDGADTFLRIQETGDPRDYGMGDPGSNRKIYLTQALPGGLPATFLDDGVTLSFRARLAAPGQGFPLDDLHPDGGGGIAPWPAAGDGYVIHDGGKGPIGIRQETGDQIVSFGLVTPADNGLVSQDSLIFNSLNGTSPSGSVDTGEGTTQMLPVGTGTDFHEFWVTIQGDTSGGGTHRVDVYADGSTTADTFHVTAGDGNDEDYNYLALGQGSTGQSGAMDVDFLAFSLGALAPGAGPPPPPPPPPPQKTIYAPPPGGWAYLYPANPGQDQNPSGAALDGTWDHDNGSDQWDGTAIGSGRPGGANVLTEDDTSYLRIQDTGDPRDYGMGDPGSNRKVYFTRPVPDLLPAEFLDTGVSLSFRARLSDTAPLDDAHPDGGGGISPWPAGGDGYIIHDGGKSVFGIRQESGDEIISFALAKASDHGSLSQDCLVINSLNGTSPSGSVDTGEGTTQYLPISNINDFHEFWVTMKADTSGGGTHQVKVYTDGSKTPAVFHVTAGTGNDESYSYIALGQGATPQSGAVDIDFVAVHPDPFGPGERGLVAYYPLNGDSNDYSGRGLHGTMQGDTAFDADVPAAIGSGQSATFDGSGDYVDLGNPDDLNFATNNWTVAGWVKTTQGSKGTLFSDGGDNAGGIRYVLAQNEASGGDMTLTTDDDADKVQVNSTSTTNDGQWHHVVGIRQGNAIAVYVDGQLQDSEDLPGGYNLAGTSQKPAYIGTGHRQDTDALVKQLVGNVDDVAVWNITLPDAVIQGLADGTYTPLSAPLTKPRNPLTRGLRADDFLIIDIGPSGQRVEPGAVGLPGAPSSGTNGPIYLPTSFLTPSGDVVTLSLDNIDQNGNPVGRMDWRDRGDSNNAGYPLVLLGEDHIKNNLGIIRATLDGLPGGEYLFTAYFVDAENSQSEAIDIFLTDAEGTNVLQAAIGDASFPGGNPGGSGEHYLTTNLMEQHAASFLVYSDGDNPIQIIFDGSLAGDDEVPLSGLVIQKVVPEPATLCLLGLGALALATRRRRKA